MGTSNVFQDYCYCWYKVSSGYLHKLKLLKGRDAEWEQVMFSKIIATAGTRLVLVTCTS